MSRKRTVSSETKFHPPQSVTSEEVAKLTRQTENLPTVYFNHARVAAGYLDFRVFFGEQSVSPTGKVSFTETLCVAMTPEFAHLFLALLGQQVVAFEKIFGPVRSIPQNTEMFRKLVEDMQKQAMSGPPAKQT
jgi:Protein of unknown function (DUF3467)